MPAFREAYECIYQCMRVSSPAIQRMEMLDHKITESEQNLQKTFDKQSNAEIQEILGQTSGLNRKYKEQTEVSLYEELVGELRQRIVEYREERQKLESQLGLPSIMKKTSIFS